MPSLSEQDHEAVTAYADGELAPHARAALERRLAVEPALRAALDDIHRAKAMLAPLHLTMASPATNTRRGRRPAARVLAIAACVTLLVLVAGSFFWFDRAQPWAALPAELHARLSEQTYVLSEDAARPMVASAHGGIFRPLDLSASRLVLVDVEASSASGRETIALHYRGRRGCRLTLVAAAAETEEAPTGAVRGHDGLSRIWRAAGFDFFLLADGMDAARFAAIAAYAKAATRKMERQEALVTAMDSTYSAAAPCA